MTSVMRGRTWLCAAALMCTSGVVFGQADVIVGELVGVANTTPVGGIDAIGIGTTSCNRGTVPLLWFTGGTDNRHPVIGTNLFRYSTAPAPYSGNRFEHIGQAWLKHGFTALQGNECVGDPGFPAGTCVATSGTTLGVRCSDPYSASLNFTQSGLGPKWQVEAHTGLFPYPFHNPAFSGDVARRLQFAVADITAGSTFFVEGHYISPDDAAAGNDNNNASWRQITMSAAAGGFDGTLTGSTQREQPGILAWQAQDAQVQLTVVDVPGDGRFLIGSRVYGPSAGVYTYEYAIQNLNSHRSGGLFRVPMPGGASAANPGFRDVPYHSGEPNSAGGAWTLTNTAGSSISWATVGYAGSKATYTMDGSVQYKLASWTQGTGNDHSANALRWGTIYNYRFTSTTAPGNGTVELGLWRAPTAGSPAISMIANARTPGGATITAASTGPCCVGVSCSVLTQAACTTAGGTFSSPGATCTPDPCNIPATGACCLGPGYCQVATAAECSSQGGTYQGNNSTCSAATCPLTNDACANAIPLACGSSITGATTLATADGIASCGSSNSAPSVWFTFVPVATGSVTIETCGSANFDTVLSAHTGACGALTQVVCNDDTTGCSGNTSRIVFNATAGTTYRIRLAGWNGASGIYTVSASGTGCTSSAPANDNCANRSGVGTGATNFSTVGATTDGPAHAGCLFFSNNQITNDIWYNFPLAVNGTLTVTTCGSAFDTKIAIYAGSTCDIVNDANLIACNDDAPEVCGTGSLQSALTINTTAGQFYLIRVGGYNGATGTGVLNITTTAVDPTGACCFTDGSCQTLTASQCSSQGGSYSGNNVTCVAANCPQPTGSCCTGTACTVVTAAQCSAGGGVFNGVGTACLVGPGNPTTCCRANFNGQDGVTVQDIYDFLAQWNSSHPSADFNGVDGVTVQDIYDFLAAWNAGCVG